MNLNEFDKFKMKLQDLICSIDLLSERINLTENEIVSKLSGESSEDPENWIKDLIFDIEESK